MLFGNVATTEPFAESGFLIGELLVGREATLAVPCSVGWLLLLLLLLLLLMLLLLMLRMLRMLLLLLL